MNQIEPNRLEKLKPNMPSLSLVNFMLRRATKKYLTLAPTKKTELPPPNPSKNYLLYAHVPFCSTLCTYCSFNRFLFQEEKARKYFISLRKEMQHVKNLGYDFNEMYIGGGTTSILLDELCKTIDLAKELFNIKEVSCESDPNNIDTNTLNTLKGRVDRLSVGVQSFDDDILQRAGRYEKFGSGKIAQERLEKAIGILPILNVDLIFNFPTQTHEALQKDLSIIRNLAPNQVTTYPLMSSPSVKSLMKRSIGEVSLEKEASLYQLILDELKDEYKQISSWAFSKKGDEIIDEYVVDNDEYVGIGSGSFSFLDSSLFVNTFSLKEYSQKIENGSMGISRLRKFSKIAQMQYRMMVGLFGGEVDLKKLSKTYNANTKTALFKEILFLKITKAVYEKDGKLYPTLKGKYLALSMMKEFYIGMDTVREESRKALQAEDM